MNRVKEYYDVACQYLAISISGRWLIATHFNLVGNGILASNGDALDRAVFTAVAKKKIFPEFKKFVTQYRKIEANRANDQQYLN